MSFKHFLAEEKIKATHAQKFFNYMNDEHYNFFKQMKSGLLKAWTTNLKTLNKEAPDEEALGKYLELIPDLETKLTIATKSEKIGGSKYAKEKKSSLYVDIPYVFDEAVRKHFREELFASAKKVFKAVREEHPEFTEDVDQMTQEKVYLFKIVETDEEVRFQFRSGDAVKILFVIGVDFGSERTKTLSRDRIYFLDYLS
jgi:activator of 2-hydroxyglutaryl-CoA dehydratase